MKTFIEFLFIMHAISKVFLAPGSNLKFVGNHANRFGGAIFVQNLANENELRSRLNGCFLQSGIAPFVDIPPQDWVSLKYILVFNRSTHCGILDASCNIVYASCNIVYASCNIVCASYKIN